MFSLEYSTEYSQSCDKLHATCLKLLSIKMLGFKHADVEKLLKVADITIFLALNRILIAGHSVYHGWSYSSY